MSRLRTPALLMLAAAVVVITIAIGATLVGRNTENDEASSTYCLALGKPERTVAQLRGAIAGHPLEPTLDLTSLQAVAEVFYGDRLADEAPAAVRTEARQALRAFRAALADESDAPLDDPAVRSALAKLTTAGAEVCARE